MNVHDIVEQVACELYMKSGRVEGSDLDNWLEAERIVWNAIEEETQRRTRIADLGIKRDQEKTGAIPPSKAWEWRIQAREEETFQRNLVSESPTRSKP
ncbi:MAG TPA: hypothetical protein DCP92_08820 [Nitrospiraceae bacterium]|nr:hypothetical protein [Nitrospiraceae bacterium]